MKWAIKHKSGRTLFVTSDEFIANNRRKMGWVVEEVKMTKQNGVQVKITWQNGTVSEWDADTVVERDKAIHLNIGGCVVCIPWDLYKDGEVKYFGEEV